MEALNRGSSLSLSLPQAQTSLDGTIPHQIPHRQAGRISWVKLFAMSSGVLVQLVMTIFSLSSNNSSSWPCSSEGKHVSSGLIVSFAVSWYSRVRDTPVNAYVRISCWVQFHGHFPLSAPMAAVLG